MTLPLQVALAIVLPPVATILAWVDIVQRRDLSSPLRGWWVVLCILPTVGPLIYIGIGRGQLGAIR